jgi:uncharacterized protein YjbJ (UPF0337 family)
LGCDTWLEGCSFYSQTSENFNCTIITRRFEAFVAFGDLGGVGDVTLKIDLKSADLVAHPFPYPPSTQNNHKSLQLQTCLTIQTHHLLIPWSLVPVVPFNRALQRSLATPPTLAKLSKQNVHLDSNILTCVEDSQNEWDASHTSAKLGPATVNASGGTHIDNQDRRDGQWKETIGSAKESIGTLIGSKDLQQSGRDQSQEGQAQSAVGQATDWIQGGVDRLRGRYDVV